MTKQEHDNYIAWAKTLPLWLLIAYTLYGEARNQSDDAKVAVAKVMLRRQQDNMIWNDILAPYQFSCWNYYVDPEKMKNFITMVNADPKQDPILWKCIEIAFVVLRIPYTDFTATHYHDVSIPTPESWKNMTYLYQIDELKFYREA